MRPNPTVKNHIFLLFEGIAGLNCTVKNDVFSYLGVLRGQIVQSKNSKITNQTEVGALD